VHFGLSSFSFQARRCKMLDSEQASMATFRGSQFPVDWRGQRQA
jgi:hypothetical protein